MSEIQNIQVWQPKTEGGDSNTVKPIASPKQSRAPRGVDTVEFSIAMEQAAFVSQQSSLRSARVAAIKREIAEGTYVTPERLRGTVERLLDIIA